jgi:methylase of polypeptide subunit release factors
VEGIIAGASSLKVLSELFILCESDDGKWLISEQLNLIMKIKPGGYVPKSGLILAQYLQDNIDLCCRRVLDIGTGEVGFLAQYAFAAGASTVIGCDAELDAIEHAKGCSNTSYQIHWQVSDVYLQLDKNNSGFDVILSNPPQMPMQNQGSWHDYGFRGSNDGRAVIQRIIKSAPQWLSPGGRIFMLIFDFLGIEQSYDSCPNLCQFADEMNMSCKIVGRYPKIIRHGGETEKNLGWIKEVYPKYKFKQCQNGQQFDVCIVEFCYK